MKEKKQTPIENSDFLSESIKRRPINRKKLFKKTLTTVLLAVLFGIVACVSFFIFQQFFNKWGEEEETVTPQTVTLPVDEEEMSPEEMLAEYMQQEALLEQAEAEAAEGEGEDYSDDMPLSEEQINQILSNYSFTKNNYREMYVVLAGLVQQLNRYMVTITAVSSDSDWLDISEKQGQQVSGVIIAENGVDLLILANYSSLLDAESLSMTFYNGLEVDVALKGMDRNTNLAILSTSLEGAKTCFANGEIPIAYLGASAIGVPVIAMGSPLGSSGSIGYGVISGNKRIVGNADSQVQILQTDIYGSKSASGVIFNVSGQVLGIIADSEWQEDGIENLLCAYGMSSMKVRIEKIINGVTINHLGITGTDITQKAHISLGIPYGAYVTDIELDSPAMLAGVQMGDVITEFNGQPVNSFADYIMLLQICKEGQEVDMTVYRQFQDDYKEMKFTVVLSTE